MPNGNVVNVEDAVFEVIQSIVLESDLTGVWLTYGAIFSQLKPEVVDAVDAGVWNFGAVLQEMVNQGTVDLRIEDDEQEYFIKRGDRKHD